MTESVKVFSHISNDGKPVFVECKFSNCYYLDRLGKVCSVAIDRFSERYTLFVIPGRDPKKAMLRVGPYGDRKLVTFEPNSKAIEGLQI